MALMKAKVTFISTARSSATISQVPSWDARSATLSVKPCLVKTKQS